MLSKQPTGRLALKPVGYVLRAYNAKIKLCLEFHLLRCPHTNCLPAHEVGDSYCPNVEQSWTNANPREKFYKCERNTCLASLSTPTVTNSMQMR